VRRRGIKKGSGLIHHSDRGSQYLSIRYSERLTDVGAAASVGSVADLHDNAMAEALNGSFKAELIEHHGPWRDSDKIGLYETRFSSEASASVKLFSIRRSVEAQVPDRTARLERVLQYLEETGQVGSVDEPGAFFKGVLPMQWGPLRSEGGGSLVYFGGRTERTVLGLGGAGHHVLGGSPSQAKEFAPSSTPAVVAGLAAAFAADGAGTPESPQGMQGAEQSALAWVYTAGRLLRGPQQSVEFVARRAAVGPYGYGYGRPVYGSAGREPPEPRQASIGRSTA
jgi:hypothetical protein